MVGSALVRALQADGDRRLVTRAKSALDLTRQSEVEDFFSSERIGQVYIMTGKDQAPIARIPAGDIGAVAKLNITQTGDTLYDAGVPLRRPGSPAT